MGALVGIRGQSVRNHLFDASGTITTGGTPQLILPEALTRSSLFIINTSSVNMLLEIGGARATATLSGGTVASCAVTNAGFGYSRPPKVIFYGGQNLQQTMPSYALRGLPEWVSPSHVAQAHCVMTGSAPNMSISSIVIDDPGANYAYPPYVFLSNDPLDPYGCAVPSATVGILLLANGANKYEANGSVNTTDQISAYCATTGSAYACKYTL